MKYPQLVSMPSSVQDWLDEQLEARGIDAVVYTRHILSLLQRDTLDVPEDVLTHSPYRAKEVTRRGPNRKRGRREEYGHVWDCERLKRSAAVECLMSASDQKCGIEKLVDDLCIKLKEIKSQGESSVVLELSEASVHGSLAEAPSNSPHDEARKYYAAFPPLSGIVSESKPSADTLHPEQASVWSYGKRSSTNAVDHNGESSEQSTCRNIWEEDKENRFGNKNGNASSWKEIGREGSNSREQARDKLESQHGCHKETGYGFAWSMNGIVNGASEEAGHVGLGDRPRDESRSYHGSNSRLYQRQADSPSLNGADSSDDDPRLVSEDGNLARLIAKFDESIEALWSPTEVDAPPPPPPTSSGLSVEVDCYQELPVDLSQLLSSPSPAEQSLAAELGYAESKVNSFIPLGTNITSSIWSDCTEDSMVDTDSAMRSTDEGELASSCPTLAQLMARDCGAVGSRFIPEPASYCQVDKSYALLLQSLEHSGDGLESSAEERADITWNESETLPSFFTGLPFGLSYALGDLAQDITSQKWSDYESASELGSVSPFGRILAENRINFQRSVHYSNRLSNVGIDGRFTTLNHNKDASSFTEVIPKSNYDEKHTATDTMTERTRANYGVAGSGSRPRGVEGEEEDLLTSARTHFKPIKQENADSLCGSIRGYADGTTFVIPDGLEMLPFKRCPSGTLYLESDERLASPAKYREYKEKEPYGGRRQSGDDDDDSSTFGSEFIPKFKVCTNEKYCQTDDTERMTSAPDEAVTSKRSRHEILSLQQRADAFFFPGDEHLATLVTSCLDDEDDDDGGDVTPDDGCATCDLSQVDYLAPFIPSDFQCLKHSKVDAGARVAQAWREQLKVCYKCNNNNNNGDDGNGNDWKMESRRMEDEDGTWGQGGGQPWADIWSAEAGRRAETPCRKCGTKAGAARPAVAGGKDVQYDRLREELSRDGEQLLSDLSYMQHLFLGSGWLEETREVGEEETPVGEWGDDEDGGEPLAQKFQCISPTGDNVANFGDDELMLYGADPSRCSRSLPGKHLAREKAGGRCEVKSVDDFFSKCLLNVLPKAILLHAADLEAEWKLNERPLDVKVNAKDRKRRHSASQRVVSREVATTGATRSQTSCVKGITCPQFLLDHVRALRPVTL